MNPKKTLSLLLALGMPFASAENLTQADREALLERLDQIRKQASSKVDARFRAAISAFSSAMSDENSTMDLYLKCEEMVNFDEMKKKSGDFRDWKRSNAELLSDKNFKTALRHQLRWLILTMEAASEKPDRDHLAIEAQKILDSIMSQAGDLAGHRAILQQGVTESVFARAYDINGVKVENWPLSPVLIQPIYDQVLLPPLRTKDRLTALKNAWNKRMIHEGTIADLWSGQPGGKIKAGTHSPEYDKFVSGSLPQLQWASEIDLFNAGDERASAVHMLAHIEKNITHESAPQWAADFIGLLQKKPAANPTPGEEPEESEEPAP